MFVQKEEWHWFKGGLFVSILSVCTYYIFASIADRNYPFGVTAGFGYISSFVQYFSNELSQNPVILRYAKKPDAFIEFFIIIGLILGGFTAAKLSGNYHPENIPIEWENYHGKSLVKRYTYVSIGSILLGYGAGLASGCTTGNILQGWAHLSTGSITAGISFFISGIISARLLYPNVRGQR